MPSLTVEARPQNLKKLRAFVEEGARQAGFDRRGVYAVALAVDEAAANIMEHGYRGAGGLITCSWELHPRGLAITLHDTGQACDPNNVPPPDLDSGLFERKAGGLGVHLMRQMMDEIRYRSTAEGNFLTLIKHRPQEH